MLSGLGMRLRGLLEEAWDGTLIQDLEDVERSPAGIGGRNGTVFPRATVGILEDPPHTSGQSRSLSCRRSVLGRADYCLYRPSANSGSALQRLEQPRVSRRARPIRIAKRREI